MKPKLMSALVALALLTVVATPAAANGPAGTVEITEDGTLTMVRASEGFFAVAIYVEFCGVREPVFQEREPFTELDVFSDPRRGAEPFKLARVFFVDDPEKSWEEGVAVEDTTDCSSFQPPPGVEAEISSDGSRASFRTTEGVFVAFAMGVNCEGDIIVFEQFEPVGEGAFEAPEGDVFASFSVVVVDSDGTPVGMVHVFRNCFPEGADLEVVVPMMWLLTGPYVERLEPGVGYAGNTCMLISETHPSVERQNALCFPTNDPDWQATNAPCAGPVWDDGSDYGLWACDRQMRMYGAGRLPLFSDDGRSLWSVYQRHLSVLRELGLND